MFLGGDYDTPGVHGANEQCRWSVDRHRVLHEHLSARRPGGGWVCSTTRTLRMFASCNFERLYETRLLGGFEGQNLVLTERHADGALNRLPELASELVASKVEVIIALGPAVWAAKKATTTVPIIIAFSGNPEQQGVVTSIARPGGNLTGFSYMSSDLAAKRSALLCEIFLKMHSDSFALSQSARTCDRGGAQGNRGWRAQQHWRDAPGDCGARCSGSERLRHCGERRRAGNARVHPWLCRVEPRTHHGEAAQHRLPILYGWRDFVWTKGVMSYGPDIATLVRGAARYVDQILKGEKTTDLPVQEPDRLQLIVI